MIGWPVAIGAIAVSALIGAVVWFRPEKITPIRINLLWLSTLVAILTITFGNKLIDILEKPGGQSGTSTSTIEIVLSSLVGVGIGGLIAIAGQLVQDSGSSSSPASPRTDDKGKEEEASQP